MRRGIPEAPHLEYVPQFVLLLSAALQAIVHGVGWGVRVDHIRLFKAMFVGHRLALCFIRPNARSKSGVRHSQSGARRPTTCVDLPHLCL